MKKTFLILTFMILALAIYAQSATYIKYEIASDTTYTKRHNGKIYEYQDILTTDGRTITITSEVKDTSRIIKKLKREIESLTFEIKMINEETEMANKEAITREKRKEALKRKRKFKRKRLKNIQAAKILRK